MAGVPVPVRAPLADVARYLIQMNADVNSMNPSLLCHAVLGGQLDMARALLDAGASVESLSPDGTSLLIAVKQDNYGAWLCVRGV